LFIEDLDNPFDYVSNGEGGTEISLKPLAEPSGEFISLYGTLTNPHIPNSLRNTITLSQEVYRERI
jgi:hypothetical protein